MHQLKLEHFLLLKMTFLVIKERIRNILLKFENNELLIHNSLMGRIRYKY